MADESRGPNFWASLPGTLTGLAALITAAGAFYAIAKGGADRDPVPPATMTPAGLSQTVDASNGGTPLQGAETVQGPAQPARIEAAASLGQTCQAGFVWREAGPADHVCVTPTTRDETAEENRLADERRSPTGGAYGPNTCLQGFVWRGAFEGDLACVPVESRERASVDNAAAAERLSN